MAATTSKNGSSEDLQAGIKSVEVQIHELEGRFNYDTLLIFSPLLVNETTIFSKFDSKVQSEVSRSIQGSVA